LGEKTPNYYTPVKKTRVIVEDNAELLIIVSPLQEIPFGGTSLDTFITLLYSSQSLLTIQI